jgi:hypothetical protein
MCDRTWTFSLCGKFSNLKHQASQVSVGMEGSEGRERLLWLTCSSGVVTCETSAKDCEPTEGIGNGQVWKAFTLPERGPLRSSSSLR